MAITPCEENEPPLTKERGRALAKYTVANIESIMKAIKEMKENS